MSWNHFLERTYHYKDANILTGEGVSRVDAALHYQTDEVGKVTPIVRVALKIEPDVMALGLLESRVDTYVNVANEPVNYAVSILVRSYVSVAYDETTGMNTLLAAESLLDDPALLTPRARAAITSLCAAKDLEGVGTWDTVGLLVQAQDDQG